MCGLQFATGGWQEQEASEKKTLGLEKDLEQLKSQLTQALPWLCGLYGRSQALRRRDLYCDGRLRGQEREASEKERSQLESQLQQLKNEMSEACHRGDVRRGSAVLVFGGESREVQQS